MKTLKLKNNGDLEFDSRMDLEMVDEIDEVKQRIKIKMNTNEGEWMFNLLFGIPWIERLSNSEPPEVLVGEVREVLENDDAVDEIVEINYDFDKANRGIEINFIAMIDGERFDESVVIE